MDDMDGLERGRTDRTENTTREVAGPVIGQQLMSQAADEDEFKDLDDSIFDDFDDDVFNCVDLSGQPPPNNKAAEALPALPAMTSMRQTQTDDLEDMDDEFDDDFGDDLDLEALEQAAMQSMKQHDSSSIAVGR
jgi:hypothetical protein